MLHYELKAVSCLSCFSSFCIPYSQSSSLTAVFPEPFLEYGQAFMYDLKGGTTATIENHAKNLGKPLYKVCWTSLTVVTLSR